MKIFNHVEFTKTKFEIERIDDTPPFRLYRVPGGNLYPSVTSVLSVLDHSALDAWKAAVGEKEAARISKEATDHGTRIHSLCEDYLNNNLNLKMNPLLLDTFNPLKKKLEKHVDNVYSTELLMFSDRLKCAGTTDLIAEFDQILSLIDFKTSKRHKSKEDIVGYFLQGSAYAMMAYELYNLKLKQIVIMMLVEGGDVLIFKEDTEKWIKKFISVRKKFKEVNKL
jgi:PD-(D/E)XK nuclease superfamily